MQIKSLLHFLIPLRWLMLMKSRNLVVSKIQNGSEQQNLASASWCACHSLWLPTTGGLCNCGHWNENKSKNIAVTCARESRDLAAIAKTITDSRCVRISRDLQNTQWDAIKNSDFAIEIKRHSFGGICVRSLRT